MRENCKSSLLVARSISCRRRSHANCCIKVKNLQLQHQLHSHTRGHRHAYKCVASLSQRSSSRQWQRHLSVHTRTHSYTHTHMDIMLPLMPHSLLLLFTPSPCCRLSCQSAHICATNVASHCIASHVLFLSFDLRLPAD